MANLPSGAQSVIALDIRQWFGGQRQSLRSLYGGWGDRPLIDETVQQVEDMGLGRYAGLQGQVDGGEHGLLVMLENQSQDLDHLAIAARPLEQLLLQRLEGGRQFGEGSAVAQSTGFALDDRQIVPPVVNRLALPIMGAGKDPTMLTDDLALGDD